MRSAPPELADTEHEQPLYLDGVQACPAVHQMQLERLLTQGRQTSTQVSLHELLARAWDCDDGQPITLGIFHQQRSTATRRLWQLGKLQSRCSLCAPHTRRTVSYGI